jgi:basic membrane protein A
MRLMVAALIALAVVAAGCGSSSSSSSTSTGSASSAASSSTKPLKVDVMLFGSANDGSWNQSMADAVKSLAPSMNLNVRIVENVTAANAARALTALASTHPDLIIAHAYEFGTALDTIGPRFPGVDFLQGSPSDNTTSANVSKYDMRPAETSYLAGMAAASVSKNHSVAVPAGVKQPGLVAVADAFVMGAKAIDPTIKSNVAYVGSYEDPAGGKALTTAQINQGADVIYALGDGTAVGTVEAIQAARAQGKHVLAVGAYYNLHNNFPSLALTSVQYNWGVAVKQAVNAIRAHQYGHKIYLITTANGGHSLSPYYQFGNDIPPADMAKITKAEDGFKNGTFSLPPTLANAD